MSTLTNWLRYRFNDPDRFKTSLCAVAGVGSCGVALIWLWLALRYLLR